MKFRKLLMVSSVFLVVSLCAEAQETNEVELLKQQLKQVQESFLKVQQEQSRQIELLTKKLGEIEKQQSASAEKAKLEGELAAELQKNQPAPAQLPAQAWSASQPLTIARAGGSYMNVSFDALMDVGGVSSSSRFLFLQPGDHDPKNNGFSIPNAEIALDGAIDPYFKGAANIVFKLDSVGRTEVELEEAYFQTTSLPGNLQLKAGQFFANFGRQNPQHPHQWAFVDSPVALDFLLGADGLRGVGAQLSWLAPLPFYAEASLGVFNPRVSFLSPFGGYVNGAEDLIYVPRVATSFDLTDEQTLVAGISSAVGPSFGGRTEVFGADIYWKWKSPTAHEGFPFVSWQTEGLYKRSDGNGFDAWSAYSQVLWGFKPRWVAGLREDYVGFPGASYRVRSSPNITWYPSEFSKIRLQYNLDCFNSGSDFGHAVWLQFEFMLGAHGAHKF